MERGKTNTKNERKERKGEGGEGKRKEGNLTAVANICNLNAQNETEGLPQVGGQPGLE